MQRRLMITVDVEAQPARAERDHVNRLIWGRFPEGTAGIGEMMDIASRYSAPMTMFLDWAETDLYGDDIGEVGRQILGRGHDLQLHVHTDFFSEAFWNSNQIAPQTDLNLLTTSQAEAIVAELVRRQVDHTGVAPVAFRGGGYRYCLPLFSALREHGVVLDSSVNVSRETQPIKLPVTGRFVWPNGILEIPVSCVETYRNIKRPFDFNFNSAALPSADRLHEYLDVFWRERGDDAVAVLVLHSWSMLDLIDRRFYQFSGSANLKRFADFLAGLDSDVQIVSASALAALYAKDALAYSVPRRENEEVESITVAAPATRTIVAEKEKDSDVDYYAEGEKLWADEGKPENSIRAVDLFKKAFDGGDIRRAGYRLGNAYFAGKGVRRDLRTAYHYFSLPDLNDVRYAQYFKGLILRNPSFEGHDEFGALEAMKRAHEMGVPQAAGVLDELRHKLACPICGTSSAAIDLSRRKCPGCNSLERQRAFKIAYTSSISKFFDISGKNGLLISPSSVERRIFSDLGAHVVTLDIRPEVKTDIIGDICARTELEDETFDFVFASYVLTCVHDIGSAIAEMRRVLKRGGILLTIDPISQDGETIEITDLATITNHYGRDAYDRYKVGSFRRLGRRGLERALAPSFSVLPINATDPLTRHEMTVFVSRKPLADRLSELSERQNYIRRIVDRNKTNELEARCEFSDRYHAFRKDNPGVSYAAYAVALEAESVSKNQAHATLGLNITDRSKIQGEETYSYISSILNVKETDRVLEYGCGSLRVGAGFINRLEDEGFFGMDVVREFYDLGCKRLGDETIQSKKVRFHLIDEEGVRCGEAFQADHIYASAVIFHIHPDDIEQGAQNLVRLASKPGAKLLIDAKITRDENPARYSQKDGKGGWAWPLKFYQEVLSPLVLIGVDRRTRYEWEPTVDIANLIFQNPIGA